jgi:cytochrome c
MSGGHHAMTRRAILRVANAVRVLFAGAITVLAGACLGGSGSEAQAVPGGDPERGRRLIGEYGCGSCHMIPGVPASLGRVGPRFEEFADRAFIVGGLRNEPANLVRWIRFPQEIEPGTVMPNLGVSEAHAADIAAYLYTLRGGGLGPPHLFPIRTLPAH